MSSKNVFTVLRELESSKLYFPGIGYDDNYLSIEARSILSIKELDKIIQFQLSEIFSLEFVDHDRSAPYPPLGICEQELQLWDKSEHLVDYIICYRIESAKKLSDVVIIDKSSIIIEEGSIILTEHECPDCKDGFYYPFAGPPEPCQTCKGTPGPCPDCNDPPADLAFYESDSSQDASFPIDFKNQFLILLENLNPKELFNGQVWETRCVLKDKDLIDNTPSGFATYFYKFLQSELQLIGAKIFGFDKSSIVLYYDYMWQSSIMRLRFFTEHK